MTESETPTTLGQIFHSKRTVTDRWKATALLEGLTEARQEEVASVLEEVLIECVRSAVPLPATFTNCVFPVVRRLMGQGETLDVKTFYPQFLEYVKTEDAKVADLSSHVDQEVELCERFVASYSPSR